MVIWCAVTTSNDAGVGVYHAPTQEELITKVLAGEVTEDSLNRLRPDDRAEVMRLLELNEERRAMEEYFRAAIEADTGEFLDFFSDVTI